MLEALGSISSTEKEFKKKICMCIFSSATLPSEFAPLYFSEKLFNGCCLGSASLPGN
jgi:hypothetical protein